MTRDLESWAQPARERRGPRLTWFADMFGFRGSLFGLRNLRPTGAPPRARHVRDRLAAADVRRAPDLLNLLTWRLDYQVAGLDGLKGLQGPVVFAANESGALDWQVLRAVLPPRLRTTNHRLSRSLAAGRSVVVFSEESVVDGEVGEFTSVAAELANQYNVPLVPVALVGTFKLKEVLRLALATKPRVSVRFGAPLYVRGRSLLTTTGELQAAVGELFHSGDLSWWAVQRRSEAPTTVVEPMPRWRRLWQQTAPRRSSGRRRIWD